MRFVVNLGAGGRENIYSRRVVGVFVMLALLGICQIWVPLTLERAVSAIVTAAIFVVAFVILCRKGLLENKDGHWMATSNGHLWSPDSILFLITIIGSNFSLQAVIQRSSQGTWLQQGEFLLASVVQWMGLFLLVIFAVAVADDTRRRRRNSL